MKTKSFTLSCLLVAAFSYAQQNYWKKLQRATGEDLAPRTIMPKTFSLYQLNLDKIKTDLKKAPQRFSTDESLVLQFPDADGNFQDYIVQEASVMEPELQAKFSDVRSYIGWQKKNSGNTIRFSITPETGISMMYFDGWEISYLDAYTHNNSSYIFYKRKDVSQNNRSFDCGMLNEAESLIDHSLVSKAPLVADGYFRTYRLALAATGEYTVFHGGTVGAAMAAMATTMTRVNGVYEKTIASTMVMVANNNLLIYTNGATDPYSNGNAGAMLSENQTTVNTVIGAANYDIGHVFGTNSGGVAMLRALCSSTSKAKGVTGSGAPVNDPFDIDYVAHEMGHQFGANHTFAAVTGSCGGGNINQSTAYEPGSGTTIMAYAGICGANNNVQANSSPYFHAASVNEMYATITRSVDCSSKVYTGNTPPVAEAGADYIIPKGTAFVLTGQGYDPDNDPVTYLWEEYDNQNSIQPPLATSVAGPLYRSQSPNTQQERYFPEMVSVLANNLVPKWEVTPAVARILNFSLLVNDNKISGNQSARDAMMVTVTNDGPFTVTSHGNNNPYNAGPNTITWNVAGTNTGMINTQEVAILLSKDGGNTFDTVLAANVPNNGSAVVDFPNENIASARIMVKAVGNIYFAVNTSNFSVAKMLSTKETEVKNFAVYPNPAHHEVNIRLKNSTQKAEYSLTDASGRLVKTGNFNGEAHINISGLTAGMYVMTITTERGEKHAEKLIIK